MRLNKSPEEINEKRECASVDETDGAARLRISGPAHRLVAPDTTAYHRLVATLIRRLPGTSRVRDEAVRQLIAPGPIGDVAPLLAALPSRPRRRMDEATVAVWTLGRAVLTEEQQASAVPALVRTLVASPNSETLGAAVDPLRIVALGIAIGSGAFGAGDWLVDRVAHGHALHAVCSAGAAAFGCTCAAASLSGRCRKLLARCREMVTQAAVLIGQRLRPRTWMRVAAARSLGAIGRTEAIEPLAMAASGPDMRFASVAADALLRCAGGLTERDYGTFGPLVTDCLVRLLILSTVGRDWRSRTRAGLLGEPILSGSCGDAEDAACPASGRHRRALDVLQALAKVGTGRALRPVRWAARHAADEGVRERAALVGEVLAQRAALEQSSSTLLRAGARPLSTIGLVTPAVPTPEQSGDELLRAGASRVE